MSGAPRRRTTRRGSAKAEQQEAVASPSSSSSGNAPPLVLPSPRLLLFARIVVFSIVTIGFALYQFKPWQRDSLLRADGQSQERINSQIEALLRPLDSDAFAICASDASPSDQGTPEASSSWVSQQLQRLFAPRPTASTIYTLRGNSLHDPSPASCILIRSKRIHAVGTYPSVVEPWCPSSADCDIRILPSGYTLLPSFYDAHGHLLDLGHSLSSADLSGATSLDEVVQRLEDYVVARPWLTQESWLQAYGWDHTRWNDTQGDAFPTMNDFSARSSILKGRKIVAKRIDFHALWLSEAAVEAVAAASPSGELPRDVKGGLVVRAGDGAPTGILIDNAMQLAIDVMPARTDEDRLRYLTVAEDLLLSYGVTSVGDAAANLEDLAFYRRMDEERTLRVRVHAFLACPKGKPYCDHEAKEALHVDKVPFPGGERDDSKLVARTVKLFADGALGSWGSALREPYADRSDERGLLLLNETDLRDRITYWHDRGWQVAVHAIGDRANSLTLDAFEELASRDGEVASRRHRVEHAQLVRPQDHGRFESLGVVASVQPTHCTSDMGYVAARIGEERARDRAYPWKSLLHPYGRSQDDEEQEGADPRVSRRAHLALGSDFPVESSDPILGLWSATQRLDLSTLSSPHGRHVPWYGDERLTPLEALRGFTTEAAYAQFEDDGGRLEVGARADFVVVRGDVLNDLTVQEVEARRKRGAKEGQDRPAVVGTAIGGQWAWTEAKSQ